MQLMPSFLKHYEEPTPSVITELDIPDRTPDIWQLEQYKRQLIFVPDDMKTGMPNNKLIADASFIPRPKYPVCYTRTSFTMWKKDLGKASFPVILPDVYRPTGFVRWEVEAAPIQGELWSIEPSRFILLDNHKQNGVMFQRQRVDITLPYREVGWGATKLPKIGNDINTVFTPAWMYVGVTEYWDAQIGGVFARSQVEPKQPDLPRRRHNKFYAFEL